VERRWELPSGMLTPSIGLPLPTDTIAPRHSTDPLSPESRLSHTSPADAAYTHSFTDTPPSQKLDPLRGRHALHNTLHADPRCAQLALLLSGMEGLESLSR
jgi:hypothetical protein